MLYIEKKCWVCHNVSSINNLYTVALHYNNLSMMNEDVGTLLVNYEDERNFRISVVFVCLFLGSISVSGLMLKFCCLVPHVLSRLVPQCVCDCLFFHNVLHQCLIVFPSLVNLNHVFLSSCARLSCLPNEQSCISSL